MESLLLNTLNLTDTEIHSDTIKEEAKIVLRKYRPSWDLDQLMVKVSNWIVNFRIAAY